MENDKKQRRLTILKILCYLLLLALLVGIGSYVRLDRLGELPAGINQDEAYAAYESWSLLNTGKDSWGYQNPVYFISWGSGMNVLSSYLMMPFIDSYGLDSLYGIRLPQAILACLTLLAVAETLRQLFGARVALLGAGLLAVSPWHIMMSRWGLESNYAVAFLSLGLLFFVLGWRKSPLWWLLSALFYGLSLYAYAMLWFYVPLLLGLSLLYLLLSHQLKFSRWMLPAVLVLFLVALPLLLFVAVNMGLMEEIRSPLFSVPLMPHFRGSEFGLANMGKNAAALWEMLSTQSDGYIWNSIPEFGLYYFVSVPFVVLGVVYALVQAIRKPGHPVTLMLIHLLVGVLIALAGGVGVNRNNSLHPTILFFAAYGIEAILALLPHIALKSAAACLAAVLFGWQFFQFTDYYFTDYHKDIDPAFQYGFGEALEFANTLPDHEELTIAITSEFAHSLVLYHNQTPAEEYLSSVDRHWLGYDYHINSFDRYYFTDFQEYWNCIWIDTKDKLPLYRSYRYKVHFFGNAMVAWY